MKVMQKVILQSLARQAKGLELLGTLLDQELRLLKTDAPQAVAGLEFSIQELLRQIASEKACVAWCMRKMGVEAAKLAGVKDRFAHDHRVRLEELLADIDKQQQECARKAAMNAEIAKALQEQSNSLLSFFRQQVIPKSQHTYSPKGRWATKTRTATLISGSL
jgi:flagellar biosynthesis/type III secretory pathway chaperone